MSNRNRTAGHNYERKVVNELKELGFNDVVTARSESRNKDNLGIDIFGDSLPFDIQCKVKVNITNNEIKNLLSRGDKKPLIIIHKKVNKAGVKFMPDGEYAYMHKDLLYKLLNYITDEL